MKLPHESKMVCPFCKTVIVVLQDETATKSSKFCEHVKEVVTTEYGSQIVFKGDMKALNYSSSGSPDK